MAEVTWIQNNAAVYGISASLAEEAGWALAGEVTLAEFGAMALATLSAPEFVAALLAVGAAAVAIGAIIIYIQCQTGN